MCGGGWNPLRDTVESGLVLAGNYFLPGSELLTSQLASKGSQEQLSSPLGVAASLGTGGVGAAEGNFSNYGTMFGGGPASADVAAGSSSGGLMDSLNSSMQPAVTSGYGAGPGVMDTLAASTAPAVTSDYGTMAALAGLGDAAGGLAPGGAPAGGASGAGGASTAPADVTPASPTSTGIAPSPAASPIGGTSAGAPTSAPGATEGAPIGGAGGSAAPTAAPASVAPTTAAPSTGPLSSLKSLGQTLGLVNTAGTGIGPTAIPALSTAFNAYSQSQRAKALEDAQKKMADALKPVEQAQANLLAQYNSGQLNAADAQAINDWTQNQLAKTRQYFAQSGMSGSQMAIQAEGQIMQQAESMRIQALNNMLQQGLKATGTITGPLGTMASQQVAADAGLQSAMTDFMKAAGSSAASKQGAPAGG